MKTKLLPLDYATPLHPVAHHIGKRRFRAMRRKLEKLLKEWK